MDGLLGFRFRSPLFFLLFAVYSTEICYFSPTSFPGSLILPPPSLAPGGGKMRDPGNEVDFSREEAVLKTDLLGKGLTQGISGERGSP